MRHLHAHFAHGSTTVAWLASTITGARLLVHRPRQGRLLGVAQPGRAAAAASCAAASFAVTCTEPRGASTCSGPCPATPVHRVYHGLNADFARLLGDQPPRRSAQRLAARARGRAAGARRRASTCWSRRAACSPTAGSRSRRRSPARTASTATEIRRLIAARGRRGAGFALAGPLDQASSTAPTSAPTLLPALPHRSTTATATGSPTSSSRRWPAALPVVTTAVSGIPELVRDGDNGLLVPPDDPEAVRRGAAAAADATPSSPPASAAPGASPCCGASTATGSRAGWPPCSRRRSRDRGRGDHVRPGRRGRLLRHLGHAYRDLAVAEAVCAGRFTHAGIDARARAAARLARRRAARRRGVADRVDEVLLTASTSPTRTRPPDERALPAAPGSAWCTSWIEQVPAGLDTDRRRRAAGLELDLRLAPVLPRRRASLGSTRPRSERCSPASSATSPTCARNLTPGPQRNHRTLELYALLVAALALPGPLDPRRRAGRVRARRARPQPARGHARRRRPPRELDPLPPARAALVPRGARERAALRPRPPGRLRRAARARVRVRAALPPPRRADLGPLRRRQRPSTAELLELAGASARAAATSRGSPAAASAGRHRPDSRRELPRRRLLHPAQRLGRGATAVRGRALPDLRLRPARRRRPRALRPARASRSPPAGARCSSTRGATRTPRSAPNLRRWFKGTAAHNTVCVDGLDQTPYRRGKPRGAGRRGTLPRPLERRRASTSAGRGPQSRATTPIHTRAIAFVADEYWLIEDRLRAPSRHRYDLRFHLAPEAEGETLRRARRRGDRGPGAGTGPGARPGARRRPRARLGRAGLRRAARGAGRQRRDRGDRRRGS